MVSGWAVPSSDGRAELQGGPLERIARADLVELG